MEPLALAASAWAFLAGWIAPGAAVAGAFRLGRDPLERLVVAWAVGRVLLAAAALVAASTVGTAWLPVFAALSLAAAAWAFRWDGDVTDLPEVAPALALGLGASALLVYVVVARGGLPDASGALVFFGRDSTNDPLTYAAVALQLHDTGLPMTHALLAGAETTSNYVPYGQLVGLHALGVPMLDAALRVAPAADVAGASLSAVVLARALGARRWGMAFTALLVPCAGEASYAVSWLAAALGHEAMGLDSWALFGPYLLPVNPGAAGLQVFFAAGLLLARAGAGRAPAIVAGLLLASLFETKVFFWGPAIAALVFVALFRPPRSFAPSLRWAAAAAVLASLPSLLEKVFWSLRIRGGDVTGFELCPGCLARYLFGAALGSGDLSFALFRDARVADLLRVETFLAAALASLGLCAVALGARALALPDIVRWSRGLPPPDAVRPSPDPRLPDATSRPARASRDALVALHRVVGLAAALGLAAATGVVTRPHYLNGAQFAWIAAFGLWPFAAPLLDRWVARRRALAVGLVVVASLGASGPALVRLGYRAPAWLRVTSDEVALLREVRARTGPGDLVLEPSMIAHPDAPSPVAWLAGRPVVLTLFSAAMQLPEAEREGRFDRIVDVFAGTDVETARAAIDAIRPDWIYAPAAWPLRFPPGDDLEVALRSPAGTLYRVRR